MRYFTLLLFTFNIHLLYAQWEQLPMPNGGRIDYLGTVNNRVWAECGGQNYHSDDQGANWQRWMIQDSLNHITLWLNSSNLIAQASKQSLNPSQAPRKTIFRSTDNGNTWQALFYDTLQQYHFKSAFMAGDYLFMLGSGPGFGNFLYRSSDLGKTWELLDVQESGTNEWHLDEVVSDGENLMAGIWYDDDIGDAHYRRYRSSDYGQSWQTLGVPFINSEDYSVYFTEGCMVMRRANSSNPLYISYNAGSTFSQIPRDPCRNRYFFAPAGTLYAYEGDCISKYDAATQSWQTQNRPSDYFNALVQTSDGVLLTGQNNYPGIWRQLNPAAPWEVANEGLKETVVSQLTHLGDFFFLRSGYNCYRSADNCQSWNLLQLPAGFTTQIQTWGDTLLLPGLDSVYYSVDHGDHWKSWWTGDFLPLSSNVQNYGDTLFVATQDLSENIRYSPNRGAQWYGMDVPELPGGIDMLDYYVDGGRIWATMKYFGGVYFTENGGQTWTPTSVSDYYGYIEGEGSHLFLYGNQTLFSPDHGTTWFPATGIPTGSQISRLKKAMSGKWYAVVPKHGIFVSNDFGASWTLFDNPGDPEVVDVFPANNALYAYRYASGLWRRPVMVGQHNPIAATALSIYPNPAQSFVSIKTAEKERIWIHDMQGRVLYSGISSPDQTLLLDLQKWPSGVYMVKAGTSVSRLVKI